MEGQSTSPAAAAQQMYGMTMTTLALIAIGIVVVIAAIWWGTRLARRRHAAQREIVAEQRAVPEAPAPQPVTEAVAPAPTPVAPSPPPLADTEVPAAAPFGANPAAVAADLATPPRAAATDDLTQMKGVGPKLAARLNELGITRYEQVAALSPEQAEALDAELGTFRGRLTRDRWIDQANYLAKGDRDGFEAAFGKL